MFASAMLTTSPCLMPLRFRVLARSNTASLSCLRVIGLLLPTGKMAGAWSSPSNDCTRVFAVTAIAFHDLRGRSLSSLAADLHVLHEVSHAKSFRLCAVASAD